MGCAVPSASDAVCRITYISTRVPELGPGCHLRNVKPVNNNTNVQLTVEGPRRLIDQLMMTAECVSVCYIRSRTVSMQQKKDCQ